MRRSVSLLVLATLALAGCQQSARDGNATDANTATADLGPPANVSTTAIVPQKDLAAIELPIPHNAPANGTWSEATAGGDGDRSVNYQTGDNYWISLRFLDCNLPMVKEGASKPANERGDFAFCLDKPTGQLDGYPMMAPGKNVRAIRAGHLALIVSVGAAGFDKITSDDLEALIRAINPGKLARM